MTAARWTSSISLKFTLSPTPDAERKKQISETIEKDFDIWNGFRLHFYCMPFADHNKQNGHTNFAGTENLRKKKKDERMMGISVLILT